MERVNVEGTEDLGVKKEGGSYFVDPNKAKVISHWSKITGDGILTGEVTDMRLIQQYKTSEKEKTHKPNYSGLNFISNEKDGVIFDKIKEFENNKDTTKIFNTLVGSNLKPSDRKEFIKAKQKLERNREWYRKIFFYIKSLF